MKKVEESAFLSGEFVEARVRDAFKKNKYCKSFAINCKFPRHAVSFMSYASKKLSLTAQIKEDLRVQICETFKVTSIEKNPYCEVEKLENFINREYCPSPAICKAIYHLTLFYESIRLREELKLDETTVKENYKRELKVSEDFRRIVDSEIKLN